jgi:hypothetical protein
MLLTTTVSRLKYLQSKENSQKIASPNYAGLPEPLKETFPEF